MLDLKTLIAMRDEMENIQGGVGIQRNQQYIPEEVSQAVEPVDNITSDTFGKDGPSLGGSAFRAMQLTSEE